MFFFLKLNIYLCAYIHTIIGKMDEKAKVNVRRSIASLAAGERLELERGLYNQRSVRNTASDLAADGAGRFSVSLTEEKIIVTRTA